MRRIFISLTAMLCFPCFAQVASQDSWVLVRDFGGRFKPPAGLESAIGGNFSYIPKGRVADPIQDNGYKLRVTSVSGVIIESDVSLWYFTYSASAPVSGFPDEGPVSYSTAFPMNENPRLIELLNQNRDVIQSCTVKPAPFVFPSQPIYRLDGQNIWVDPAIQSVALLAPKEGGAQVYTRTDDFPQGVLKLSEYRWKYANESFVVTDVMQDLWLSHWEARLADLPMKPQ